METKNSEFNKVFSAWDILVIAFGAMIGWGWVVSTGEWISRAGVIGAMLGFVLGGVMIFFVGMTYAELTPAMPECGGEHVFSMRAMGPIGSFICTWAIIGGYVSVVCFEACALPTIITYIYPKFLKGYLYTIAGFDVYASWLIVAIVFAAIITMINVLGGKTAAILQTILTVVIGAAGILLVVASLFSGSPSNIAGQAFEGSGMGKMMNNVIRVAAISPFFFIGFDVIPQAAEEINVPLKKIGKILLLSIILGISFYALVIFAVGFVMDHNAIVSSYQSSGLVTADAMGIAFHSSVMAKVLIIAGMCGILTSWNSFMIGGSRALYSMADSYMLPTFFKKMSKKYKTPVVAIWLIGILSMIAPFAGRQMLVWIVDAGNFGCCLAYCMISMSFLILRKKEPTMPRPYEVKHWKFVGVMAVILSGLIALLYLIPGSGVTLASMEWVMVGGWVGLGVIFFVVCKAKYKEKFGYYAPVRNMELAQKKREQAEVGGQEVPEKEPGIAAASAKGSEPAAAAAAAAPDLSGGYAAIGLAGSLAVGSALKSVLDRQNAQMPERDIAFDYYLPVNIRFGKGMAEKVGELTKPYGKKALIVTGGSSAKKSGLYDRVKASLEKAGISTCLFDKVLPNPLTTTATEGAAFARENGCDVIVAIGGGSIMDCAKGIAFLGANGGDIRDYLYNRKQSDKAMPLVLIPTTCGTGSEGNGFAVLTNPENGDKKSLRCPAIVAKVSIVDPDVMKTMPKKVLASVGFDALCHCVEAYTANRAQPFTDALALYAIPLIYENLVPLYRGEESDEAWEKLSLASTIGGMVINTAGVTLAHAMEHPVSGLKNVVHGQGLAALAPTVLAATYKGNRIKFGRFARMIGGYTAEDCAPKIRTLLRQLNLDISLSDLGVEEKDIPWLAENCFKVSAANISNTPVQLTQEDIAELYRKAL
ncbi:MAG: bifunctional amino acid transporter/iron-containing alcohol dehydrogenase [Bilifractor sp.]